MNRIVPGHTTNSEKEEGGSTREKKDTTNICKIKKTNYRRSTTVKILEVAICSHNTRHGRPNHCLIEVLEHIVVVVRP